MSVLLVMEDVSKTVTTLLVHMIVAVMLDSSWEMTIMFVLVKKKNTLLKQNKPYCHMQMLMSVMLTITVIRTVTIHMVPITAHVVVDGIWILMDTAAMVMSEFLWSHTICIIIIKLYNIHNYMLLP